MEPNWLEINDIYAMHDEILRNSGGAAGILNKGALESTLNKPKNSYLYCKGITLYELAAYYGYGLVKNHCFVDGNKRTALIAIYTFLSINGIDFAASNTDVVSFLQDLAASLETQEVNIQRMANWLKTYSH